MSNTQDPPQLNFRKPHSLMVMTSKTGKLTLMGRKLLNVLLKVTTDSLSKSKASNTPVLATTLFEAPVTFLARNCKFQNSQAQSVLVKKHLIEMREIKFDFRAPDESNSVVFEDLNILSEVRLELRSGMLWCMWAFPPKIMQALMDINVKYSWMDIIEMNKVGSYSALALFEICWRYKDNPQQLTSRKEVDWWMDSLSGWRFRGDQETTEKKREWRKFKHEYIKPAIDDINKNTRLRISLVEEKVGKAISFAQFSVVVDSTALTDESEQFDFELIQLAAELDLNVAAISSVKKKGIVDDDIKVALLKMKNRMARDDLQPIANKTAFFKTLAAETAASTSRTDKNTGSTDVKSRDDEVDPVRLIADASLGHDAGDEVRKLQSAKEKLGEMDGESLTALKEKATQNIINRGHYTGRLRDAIERGDWGGGYAQSFLIEILVSDI